MLKNNSAIISKMKWCLHFMCYCACLLGQVCYSTCEEVRGQLVTVCFFFFHIDYKGQNQVIMLIQTTPAI